MFPCNSIKEPLTEHGVIEASTDPAKIEAWWGRWPRANIGMNVGDAGFMVVDFDPGSSQTELERNVGAVPPTKLRQKTPRGGEHWFYALSPGEVVSNSSSKLSDHVDVRSFHGYVLLWPSKTADGSYEWLEEGKPSHRTDDMVRVANSHREKDADRDNWIITPDLDENVASAIKWLKTDAKIAIEGHGGDNTAYATAAMLKSFGISGELAFDLMWEHWNSRCVPPWTAEEVDHLEAKVQNGYSYNTSPPGNITPAYRTARSQALFKPVQRELPSGSEYSSGRFRIVDREGLSHVRPAEWLVHNLLPQNGYALLVGAPGTFKTFVALDIALSVATGANYPWKGMWGEINDPGPALFAVGEGRSGFKKRVEAWELTHWKGNKARGIFLADPVPLVKGGDDDLDHFVSAALAASPQGYKLAVIDTVGRSMQGLNENAQEYVSAFTQMVERIQRELGCAVLALHHTGHDAERARGSSVFIGDPDTILNLERAGKEYLVSLSMRKQKEAPEWERPVTVKLEEIKWADGSKSLVAVKPAENEAPAPQAQKSRDKAHEMMISATLDRHVIAVLQANPTKAWSQTKLAEAVAMRGVGVGSETLRKVPLTTLREDMSTHAHRCYDAATERWRYRE